jgi:catechol 2,3-dioxygenase-like lactoylglutathione lyase family enzyme
MIEVPKVHVHMSVSNLDKSRAFYEKFFGVAPVKVRPGYVKFLPQFGPLRTVGTSPHHINSAELA